MVWQVYSVAEAVVGQTLAPQAQPVQVVVEPVAQQERRQQASPEPEVVAVGVERPPKPQVLVAREPLS